LTEICKEPAVRASSVRETAGTARANANPVGPLQIAKATTGFLLLGAGVAMLALPGPGWLTIVAGLVILADDFRWARRLLNQVKNAANRVRGNNRE